MFVDPRTQPFVRPTRCRLPHLYKPLGTYFITSRLYDVVNHDLPDPVPEAIDDDEAAFGLIKRFDPPISLGSCFLSQKAVTDMVQDGLLFNHSVRYDLLAWCIMPNHVHLVLQTRGAWTPDQILRDWKGFTARQANQILGRAGRFWETESFDHLVRRAENISGFVAYTEHNPRDAGLCARPEDWPHSSRGARLVAQASKPAHY